MDKLAFSDFLWSLKGIWFKGFWLCSLIKETNIVNVEIADTFQYTKKTHIYNRNFDGDLKLKFVYSKI